jgi:hypothetical protein
MAGEEVVSLVITVDGKKAKVGLDEVKTAAEQAGYTVDKAAQQSDGAMKSLAKAIGVTAAAWKAYRVALDSINKATSTMMGTAKLNAVLATTGKYSGVTAAAVAGLNKELQQNTIYSSGALQQAEALMGTFYNIGAETFPRAMQAAADMAAVTGSLEGATMMLSKALDDPIDGLTALSRQGFRFTDQQKELIKTMVDAGETLQAQTYILDTLEKSQRGVAKAIADTPAGQLEKLRNEYASIQAVLGEKLVPVLVKFMEAMNAVFGFIVKNSDVIAGMAAVVTTALVPGIYSAVAAWVALNPPILAATSAIAANTVALLSNPLIATATAIVAGIAAVVIVMGKMKKAAEENAEAHRKAKEAMRDDGSKNIYAVGEAAAIKATRAAKMFADVEGQRARAGLSEEDKKSAEYLQQVGGAMNTAAMASQQAYKEFIRSRNALITLHEEMQGLSQEEIVARGLNVRVLVELPNFEEARKNLEAANVIEADLERKKQAELAKIHYEANKSRIDEARKMYRQMQIDLMDATSQELAILGDEYEKRKKMYAENSKERRTLDLWYANEFKKTGDTVLQVVESQTDAVLREYNERYTALFVMAAAEPKNAEKYAAAMVELEKRKNQSLLDIYRADTAAITDEREKVQQVYEDSIVAINKAMAAYSGPNAGDRANEAIKRANAARIDGLRQITDAEEEAAYKRATMLGFEVKGHEKAREEIGRAYMARLKDLSDALQKESITREQYNAAVIRANEQRAKAERDINRQIEMDQLTLLAKLPNGYQARTRMVEIELEKELELYKGNTAAIIQLKQQAAQQIAAIEAEQWQRPLQGALQYGDAAMTVINAVSGAMQNANQRAMADIDKRHNKEMSVINKSGMAERDKQRIAEEAEQKAAQARYAQEVRQWNLDKTMAAVNGALAVIKALASAPPPANYIAAAATGAAAGIQLGVINSNRPTMAQGGFVPGTSYSGDRVDIGVNSGEVVLNPAQQRNFMALANRGVPQMREPVQVSTPTSVGIGAAQQRVGDDVAAPVQNVTNANFTIVDGQNNIKEQLQEGIRSGDLLPVIREALQLVGR